MVGNVSVTCDNTANREIEFRFIVHGEPHEVEWTITNMQNGTYRIDTLSDITQEFITCNTPNDAYLAIKNFFAHNVAQLTESGPLFWPVWLLAFRHDFETAAGKGPWEISTTYDPLYTVVIKHMGTNYAFYVSPAWKVNASGMQYKYKVAYQYDPEDKNPFGYANNADAVIRWIEQRFVPLRAAHTGPFPD